MKEEPQEGGGRSILMVIAGAVAVLLFLMALLPVVVIVGLMAVGNSLESTFDEVARDIGDVEPASAPARP